MIRQQLLKKIVRRLNKRQHVLLKGETGTGKSWLLGELHKLHTARSIRLSMAMARKPLVLTVMERMFEDGYDVDLDQGLPWEEASKRLTAKKYTVEDMVEQIEPYCHYYTFFLDDLERATERVNNDVVRLMLSGLVVATADLTSKLQQKRVAPAINRFHLVPMPPLTQEEATGLLWSLVDREEFANWQALEVKVWNVSQGKPGVIVDMVDKLGQSFSLGDIRELEHTQAGVQYIGLMLPTLLIAMVLVISSRYLSRGFNDPTAYMLAAVGYAIFRVFSPMLYRVAR